MTAETALYGPVKAFLEARGFTVKGEVRGCDLVALSGDGESVVVLVGELKTRFTLDLVLQGVERTAVADEVWLAVGVGPRGGREGDPRVRRLCRMLGLGLLGVASGGAVEPLVEPGRWAPRRNLKERSRLVAEHRRRIGDPAVGGSTRVPLLTAYRQQALAVARALADGPGRPRDLRRACPDAARLLQDNVYGWFVRVERGVYALTDAGRAALTRWV